MKHEDEIFLDALDLPPEERASFLKKTCGDDQLLHDRITRLLALSEGTEGILDRPVLKHASIHVPEQAGDVIDRFVLKHRLGEGGCGVVWLAQQTVPVRRQVALKIIKPGMDSEQVIQRFEAERQAMALMDHPAIARVFDAGTTANGRPFFAMEYVDGVPITTYCDQHQLNLRKRLQLFNRVCEAIQHAHQKGIIHRDVKPSNVLVGSDGDEPLLKVIDFGIAKATEQRLTDATLVTQLGQFLGTPAYMSPEQSSVGNGDVDTRTDVYSLGVLLYELLSGRQPFDPQMLREAGLEAMWKHIREIDPPRPSARLQTLSPDDLSTTAARRLAEAPKLIIRVSGDLDWIAMRCLEKDRRRRYGSAADLARDIQRHLDHEPVEARPAGAAYRFSRLVRRNRLGFSAAAAVALTLLTGTVVSTWQAFRASRAEHGALAAEQIARDEAAAANAVAEFLIEDMLRQSHAFGQSGDDIDPDLPVRKALDQAAAKVDERFADQPLLQARILLAIADAYLSLTLFDQAAGHFDRVVALRTEHLGPHHPDTLAVRTQQAQCHEQRAQLPQAEAILLEVIEAYEAMPSALRPEDDQDNARTILALTYNAQGHYSAARDLQERLVESYTARHGSEHQSTATAIQNLGQTYGYLGESELAENTIRQALALLEKLHGFSHPEVLTVRNELAMTLGRQQRNDEAAEILRSVFEESRRLLGPAHFRVLQFMSNLAEALDRIGQVNEAISLNEEALELARSTVGEGHQLTVSILSNLANQYSRAGRLSESTAMKEQLIGAVAQAFGEDHPNTFIITSNLGYDYMTTGRFEEAEALFQKAWRGMVQALGDTHPNSLLLRRNLAILREKTDRMDEAIALREELWKTHRDVSGADSTVASRSGVLLGQTYDRAGRFQEAQTLWRQLIADATRIHGEDSAKLIGLNGRYGGSLLRAEKWIEAETAWRELKRVQEERTPDQWATFNAHSALGAALLGQGRFAEAEPLLLSGYEGMRARRDQNLLASRLRLNETFERLVKLYEAWERPEDAAHWRAEHEAFRAAEGQ